MFEIVQESVKVYTTTGVSYLQHTFVQQLYAQNPVFEIVHDESVKVYLHIYVERECSAEPSMRRILLCSLVFSIFTRFSPTIFYRDANSVLLQTLAHHCTAELKGSMRRILCLKLFVRRA